MAEVFIKEPTRIKNIITGEESIISEGSFDPNFYKRLPGLGFGEAYESFRDATITSENVRQTEDIPFQEPETTPVFDITQLDFGITPPEAKAQTLTEQVQALNLQLVGEAEFRAEEEVRGIEALTKTQQDLAGQLKILQAEAKAIPLQAQQEAIGRGITAGGLRPITTARLRENAIKALTVSALSEAAVGNLATAHDLVNRAVSQKFDPIREEINARMANLDLIIRSPEYSQAEKKRAAEQKAIVENQKAEADRQEAEQKEIWDIATDAATKGADALTLQKIKEARTKEEALQIATEAGVFVKEEKLLTVAQAKSLGVPFGTTVKEAAAMGITPPTKIEEEEPEKLLSASEIKRLQALYPDSGIDFGDTQSSAVDKISGGVKGLVEQGFSPEQAIDIVESDTAPDWFRSVAEEDYQMSFLPEALDDLWNQLRIKLLGTKITEATETTGEKEKSDLEKVKSKF